MGEIPVCSDEPFDEMVPNSDGDVVRDEVSFACIRMVEFSCGRLGGEASKDVSRGEMEVVASPAEEFAEGPLARAGGAKN